MSPGAKLFLVVAGVGGMFGVLALAASKKASAAPGTVVVPPHDGAPPEKIPDEPEGGFLRDTPFSVPGVQDAADAQRILLRWWAAEGQSLASSDMSPAEMKAAGIPNDFGSKTSDLQGEWNARTQAIALTFEHYAGLTPADGALTNQLVTALKRWEQSQQLPPAIAPSSPSTPAPIVLPAPASPPVAGSSVPGGSTVTPPPFVPLPPIAPPAPVVPVPPLLPPLPASPGPANGPAPAPVVTTPPAAPPGPVSLPPVATVPLPPIVPPSAQPAPAPAPVPPANQASAVDPATADMVNSLLVAEGSDGWNRIEPVVTAWQKSRKLVADGKFGPKSAAKLGEEFGTIPVLRFWPKGSQKDSALQAYRASLIELANAADAAGDKVRAAQLRVSSKREQAQSFGFAQKKAPALPTALRVSLTKVA